MNATSIRIYWNITGDVNGFVINISSNGLSTLTQQLTDGSARELIYNGILPERNYTVEVRGYIHRLGPADMTTVKLEGKNHTIALLNIIIPNGRDLYNSALVFNHFPKCWM